MAPINKRGFTLIELLVVIAILGVLATVIVLVLNPAELIKQARDSTRLEDLGAINRVLGFLQADQVSPFMGTSSLVYVSVPDTSATCANLGLPTLPTGWAYACAPTSTLTKVDGTGWVPVDLTQFSAGSPLARLPIDPVNTTSTGNYYAYVTGGSWHLRTVLESSKYQSKAANDGGTSDNGYEIGSNLALAPAVFPHNWVKVPGNSTFGTNDFYVMKYEAKYNKTVDGVGDDAATANCVASSGDGLDWSDAGCSDATKVMAGADGSPIVTISHTQAVSACTSIGAHLLTNDEWMTIARNAEQASSNWSGGSVGSGCLFRGNNGTADTCGYNGSDPEKGTQRNAKASWTLSNGSIIWDIAGNVWEHVKRSVNNVGDLTTAMALPACSDGLAAWGWCDFVTAAPYISAWSSDVAQASIAPSNAAWYASQGMGRVYTYKNGTNQSTTVFIRGGYWGDGAYAGAFTLYLRWGAGDTGYFVGFRCAR